MAAKSGGGGRNSAGKALFSGGNGGVFNSPSAVRRAGFTPGTTVTVRRGGKTESYVVEKTRRVPGGGYTPVFRSTNRSSYGGRDTTITATGAGFNASRSLFPDWRMSFG